MVRELNGKPLTESMMTGAALMSTVSQTRSLGNIGQEVLKSFGIEEVDLSGYYSYKIRGAIHEAVYKRFGEEALFYFGYSQLDGYAAVLKSIGDPIEKFLKINKEKLNSKNLSIAIDSRDRLLREMAAVISILNEKSIFCPKGPLTAEYRSISEMKMKGALWRNLQISI